MIRLPKLVYAAFVAALLAAAIGVIVARAWNVEALWPVAADQTQPGSNQGVDPDYVQGLAKRGIVKLPSYKPLPPVLIDARPKK